MRQATTPAPEPRAPRQRHANQPTTPELSDVNRDLYIGLPSRERAHIPPWEKGNSSSKMPWWGRC